TMTTEQTTAGPTPEMAQATEREAMNDHQLAVKNLIHAIHRVAREDDPPEADIAFLVASAKSFAATYHRHAETVTALQAAIIKHQRHPRSKKHFTDCEADGSIYSFYAILHGIPTQ
ncbi:MAG: hypothetical protein OXQ29_19620, partial [Rhodospirillaceae bacterium]|nr:hypothetical protein [Rhodospirillaceae bacterium]